MLENIPFEIKKSKKSRSLRLAIYADGRTVLTVPDGFSRTAANKFIYEKKEWIHDKLRIFKKKQNSPVRVFSRLDYLRHKHKAYLLVRERINELNLIYGYSFNKVFIKNQKTRWGSCSGRRNLNFNFKLLFLPGRQRDYIIVHELCHLKEMNHSKKFWALVAKTFPDHLQIRRELRRQNFSV
jgi:predicted metal-dependent hydrolase